MTTHYFSTLLKAYIHNSNLNIVTISKQTGIPRSTIQKYMSGIQVPNSFEPIEKITHFLILSKQQLAELKKAYIIEKIGYTNFLKLKELKEIVQLADHFYSGQIKYNIHYNIQNTNTFAKNPEELILITNFIIEDALHTTKHLQILMNSSNKIYDNIFVFAKNNFDLSIEQIINLKNKTSDFNASNLSQLKKILPIILLENKISIKYIYSKEDTINYYSIFPYAVASSNYALLTNYDCTVGMMTNDYDKFLKNEFYKKHNHAKDFFNKKNNNIKTLTTLFSNIKGTYAIFSNTADFTEELGLSSYDRNDLAAIHEQMANDITSNRLSISIPSNSIKTMKTISSYVQNKDSLLEHVRFFNAAKIKKERFLAIFVNSNILVFLYKDYHIIIEENTICNDFLLLETLFEVENYYLNKEESHKILTKIMSEGY